MAIAYEWTFTPECADEDGLTDVVKVVHWRLTASDGGVQTPIFGAASLTPADPAGFTVLADLTEETVKGWVLEAEGTTEDGLKARVAAALAKIKAPAVTMREFSF